MQIWAESDPQVPVPSLPARQKEQDHVLCLPICSCSHTTTLPPPTQIVSPSSTPQPFLPSLTTHCSPPAPSPPSLSKRVPSRRASIYPSWQAEHRSAQNQHCRLSTEGGNSCMQLQLGLCWLASWEQGTLCRSGETRQSIGKALGSSRSSEESAGVCRVSGREQGGKVMWCSPFTAQGEGDGNNLTCTPQACARRAREPGREATTVRS